MNFSSGQRAVENDVAGRVSQSRLMKLIADLATFGAREDGGVNRQALTEMDIEARGFLANHARSIGCAVSMDSVGNVFFRRAGTVSGAAVATGSHIDSQPAGGKLDGAYGVCAGLEVLAALNDADVTTHYPIEVVVWSNEEGCRFSPGSLGSQAYVAPALLPTLLNARDSAGTRYGDCVATLKERFPDTASHPLGADLRIFIEAHIEQGPVLEDVGIPIGIVSGVQGVRWLSVKARGEAGHAGTTPLRYRRDALRAVCALMEKLYALAESSPDLRLTVGKLDVLPSSINTVPGDTVITVDVRHVDRSQIDACEAMIHEYCATTRYGCQLTVERTMALETTTFDAAVRDALRGASHALGLQSVDMISGAFHDSVHLARHCPTGMIFVPSRKGVSHNPGEHTAPELLAAGTRVLALALTGHALTDSHR